MALSFAREDTERRWDLRFGVVAAAVANTTRTKDQKPHQPTDFFPGRAAKPEDRIKAIGDELVASGRAVRSKLAPDEAAAIRADAARLREAARMN